MPDPLPSVPVGSDEPPNSVLQSTFINQVDRNSEHIAVLEKGGVIPTSDLVVQTVTNGDTTHAPSGDAVFDYVGTESGLLIPKSIMDAKGDLIVGTADDTPARLAVGANGAPLVGNSGASSGLQYGFPYCELAASGTTSIADNNVNTKIALATTVHNDTAFFTVSSSVITVLAAGIYDMTANAGIASGTSTVQQEIWITKNGTATSIVSGGARSDETAVSLAAIMVSLAANDTVQLIGRQDSAGAVSTQGDPVARLCIRKVG